MELVPTDIAENKSTNYGIYLRSRYHRVLELGPYDGTDTVYLARQADYVVAIEGRAENVRRTLKTLSDNQVENADVIQSDLQSFNLADLGQFDCVWASGILYHVEDPADLIRRIAGVTRRCFGWTHLTNVPTGERSGYSGRVYDEPGDTLSGLTTSSWWLTPDDFLRIWSDLHWSCRFTHGPTPHKNGDLAAQFLADSLAEITT